MSLIKFPLFCNKIYSFVNCGKLHIHRARGGKSLRKQMALVGTPNSGNVKRIITSSRRQDEENSHDISPLGDIKE